MRSKDFWIVVLVLFAVPFLAGAGADRLLHGDDKMSKSRRATNILGLICLVAFVVAILIKGGSSYFHQQKEVEDAKIALEDVATGFADGDREVVMSWARGERVDPWGNQLVLQTSGDDLQMISKGADGQAGTEDDLTSMVFRYPEKVASTESILKPKPSEKSPTIGERIAGWKENVFGSKESETETETDPEPKKGWSFKWSWGK